MMEIRKGTMADLEAVAAVEARCFPPEQAATKDQFRDRLRAYPEGFWLLWDGETLVGFLDGMVSGSPELTDVMFADASLHDPEPGMCRTADRPVHRRCETGRAAGSRSDLS